MLSHSRRPTHTFTLGQAVCTSGANAGLTATIKLHTGGQIQLQVPLSQPVAAGEGFTFYPALRQNAEYLPE